MIKILSILIFILATLLMVVIFLQPPKQESLGNAFQGGKTYKSKVDKAMVTYTVIFVTLLSAILLIMRYLL